METFYNTPFFNAMKPITHAQKQIQELIAQGHELVAITSRPAHWLPKTRQWLALHFPFIQEVHTAKNGHAVTTGSETKIDICKRLGISILIDDCPDYLHGCARAGIRGILFNKP